MSLPINRSLMNMLLLLIMVIALCYTPAEAQTLHLITHKTGTFTYGHTDVTSVSNAVGSTNSCNGAQILLGGGDGIVYYSLSRPTRHIRFLLDNVEDHDTFSFTVNGRPHHLKYSELSPTNSSCVCATNNSSMIITNDGELVELISDNSCIFVDIHQSRIDSFSIYKNRLQGGAPVGAYFEEDTSIFIRQPFTDTVFCAGDTLSLVYTTNFAFRSTNTFTVQLSNSSGSFANPVNIGTRADTTGDTIRCVIPYTTPPGNGYRVRILGSAPSDTSYDNEADIRIRQNPANFSAGSNTPVCTGDTLKLEGATTSTGITWSWSGPNSFSSVAEDTAIAEAAMSDAGDYILKSTLNSTGCSLYDTTTVVMKPTPTKPVIVDNSPVCQYLSLQLAVSSSTSGVSYSWAGPAGFSSSSANPSISNMQSVNAGDYIGTATLNGCSSSDTATVVVNPKPAMASASAPSSPLCARQDLQLNATTVNGANYNWYGPGGYTANSQNPSRVYMQFNDSGYYYVYTEQNTCLSDTDSVKVVVNTDPFVNIFPTPGANICDGAEAVFTAVPTNGGTPTYEWFINGVSTGQTGLTYKTSNIQQGDIVTCHMTSTGTCATPFTDTSNDIPMSVTPLLTPSVSIVSNPNTTLYPNEPVSFTAAPTNGGPTPQYQWRRNGQDIGGATGATWGANANFMSDGDEICVLMTSDYACPDPDTALSNCIKVDIRVSVEDISKDSGVKVYPNPVKDVLIVETSPANLREEVTVRLFDILGRRVDIGMSTMHDDDKIMLDMSSVAVGNYVLKVLTTEGALYFKVVKE